MFVLFLQAVDNEQMQGHSILPPDSLPNLYSSSSSSSSSRSPRPWATSSILLLLFAHFFLQDAQKGEIGSVFFWGGALLLLVTLLRVCMRVCVSVRVYVCVRECVAMYT